MKKTNKLIISFRGLKLSKTYDVSKYMDDMTESDRAFINNSTYKNLIIKTNKRRNFFLDIDNKGFIFVNVRSGIFSISLFIKQEFRKGMTGFNACVALLFYMFNVLGMNKMETSVYSHNKSSLKLQYSFLDLEGIVKQTIFDGKHYYDKFLFCMFKKDFLMKSGKLLKYFRMAGNKKTYVV